MAIGELGCHSLEYVYEMTWAEYMLRLHSYRRQQENEVMKLRELAWVTYIAPHLNPKKIKKSKNAFWPINKKKGKNGLTENMVKRIKEAQLQYQIDLKKLKDGKR